MFYQDFLLKTFLQTGIKEKYPSVGIGMMGFILKICTLNLLPEKITLLFYHLSKNLK
jgi:hypothetical protein